MTTTKRLNICLGALMLAALGAQADTVVFNADFNASTAVAGTVTDNASVANLNAGTAVGSWALSGAGNPGAIIANSNHNNNAFVFDSVIAGSVFTDLVRGNFTQDISLTNNESLVLEFDLYASRAGNDRQVRLALQNSAQADAYIFVFQIDSSAGEPKDFGYVNSSGTVVLPSSSVIGFVNPAVDSYLKGWTASPHIRIVIGPGATGANTATLSVDWNGDGDYTDTDDDNEITFGHRTANLTDIGSFELRYGGSSGNKGAYFDNIIAALQGAGKSVSLTVAPSVADNDKTDNPVTLTYTGFGLAESNSTYSIAATEGSAAFLSGGQTGSASNGAHQVAAAVDGTAGPQTVFQIIVSEGAVPVATNTATVTHQEYPPDVTTVLFADTFDRANNDNLDADTTGMSGTLGLGAGVYLETLQVSNQFEVGYNELACSIFTNLCRLGYTNVGISVQESGVGINHNFIDAAILSAGNFSMSARITANSGNVTGNDRFVALIAGCTLAEINAWTGIEDLANRNLRGSQQTTAVAARGLIGTADFSVSMSRSGDLSVVTAGYRGFNQAAVAADSPTGNLRVDFGVTDFNQGSFVSYIVYWNDVPKASGFFRWQNTGQNWLAFAGRSNSITGARLDNLQIGTCATYEGPDIGTPPTGPDSIAADAVPVSTNGVVNSVGVNFAGASNVVYALRVSPSLIFAAWQPIKVNGTGGEIVRGPSPSNTAFTATYNPLSYGTASNGPSSFCEIVPVNWNVTVQ